jgi:2-hydroxychromene-2-carboxylate isomerase
MTDRSDDAIAVYSDYVCPFCYLGRASLSASQGTREDDLRVDWHPFDLRSQQRRPDGSIGDSVDDGKDGDYYEQARENVRRLAQENGVEIDPELAPDVDSLPTQVVSYSLREHHDYETWLAFDEAVFEALWREGRDVGEPTRCGRHSTTTGSARRSASGSPTHNGTESPASRRSRTTGTRREVPSRRNSSSGSSRGRNRAPSAHATGQGDPS